MCQRPKRAFSISTKLETGKTERIDLDMCQRPKRAFSISTSFIFQLTLLSVLCQRPKRAFSISTYILSIGGHHDYIGVNALNGLFPFLLTTM